MTSSVEWAEPGGGGVGHDHASHKSADSADSALFANSFPV